MAYETTLCISGQPCTSPCRILFFLAPSPSSSAAARCGDFDATRFLSLSPSRNRAFAASSSFPHDAVILTRRTAAPRRFLFSVVQTRSRIFDLSFFFSFSLCLSSWRFNARRRRRWQWRWRWWPRRWRWLWLRHLSLSLAAWLCEEAVTASESRQYPPESRRRYALLLDVADAAPRSV